MNPRTLRLLLLGGALCAAVVLDCPLMDTFS
jgi:hypothetical protein